MTRSTHGDSSDVAAKLEVLIAFGIAPDYAAAYQLATSAALARISPTAIQRKLTALRLLGWPARTIFEATSFGSFSVEGKIVPRSLFLAAHGCGSGAMCCSLTTKGSGRKHAACCGV